MIATLETAAEQLQRYVSGPRVSPLFLIGDSVDVLREIADDTFDCAMTSPPYWGKREYAGGGIGLETDFRQYIEDLVTICAEVKRVLKPTGSFWLNIGDSYANKNLLGIPWRLATKLTDEQGWTLRNSVVWNKIKGGPDNTKDRLRSVHENVFHFVKNSRGYYYDVDGIRNTPKTAKVVKGAVVSATGVSGVRYKRQLELSTELSEAQKQAAFAALDAMLNAVAGGGDR